MGGKLVGKCLTQYTVGITLIRERSELRFSPGLNEAKQARKMSILHEKTPFFDLVELGCKWGMRSLTDNNRSVPVTTLSDRSTRGKPLAHP